MKEYTYCTFMCTYVFIKIIKYVLGMNSEFDRVYDEMNKSLEQLCRRPWCCNNNSHNMTIRRSDFNA